MHELSDAIDGFIVYLSDVASYSPETVRSYSSHLAAFMAWCGDRGFETVELEVRDLRSYLAVLKNRELSPRTIASHLSALKSFYGWLNREDMLPSNPAAALEMPKMPAHLPSVLTPEQLDILFSAVDTSTAMGKQDALILELFIATGARISEISSIDVRDIDFDQGSILLHGKG